MEIDGPKFDFSYFKNDKLAWFVGISVVLIIILLAFRLPEMDKPGPTQKPGLSPDELKFGEIPLRSQWDGSYLEVEIYLKKVAHDPSSIDIEGCSQVYKSEEGWVVDCDFRGKNAFGALVRNSKRFTIFHGQVVKVSD